MALEVGNIVEGTVTGIAKFGAFVELPEKKVGLVHISEVANEYVSDVNQYLKIHDTVKVKVIHIDDKGKIALSIKQVPAEDGQKPERFHGSHEGHHENHFHKREDNGEHGHFHEHHEHHEEREGGHERRAYAGSFHRERREAPASFEDKLSRFLKDSDERLLDLKRNVESKRGGRGARRSD